MQKFDPAGGHLATFDVGFIQSVAGKVDFDTNGDILVMHSRYIRRFDPVTFAYKGYWEIIVPFGCQGNGFTVDPAGDLIVANSAAG